MSGDTKSGKSDGIDPKSDAGGGWHYRGELWRGGVVRSVYRYARPLPGISVYMPPEKPRLSLRLRLAWWWIEVRYRVAGAWLALCGREESP